MIGILGKKLGMTNVFDEKGNNVPVTLIEAGPCHIVQIKTKDSDGYAAIQIGFSEKKAKHTNRAEAGRFKLVFATAKNLEKLGRSRSVKEAMETARNAKIVTVQPRGTRLEGGKRLLRIPPEAGYGGSEFIVEMPPAS